MWPSVLASGSRPGLPPSATAAICPYPRVSVCPRSTLLSQKVPSMTGGLAPVHGKRPRSFGKGRFTLFSLPCVFFLILSSNNSEAQTNKGRAYGETALTLKPKQSRTVFLKKTSVCSEEGLWFQIPALPCSDPSPGPWALAVSASVLAPGAVVQRTGGGAH